MVELAAVGFVFIAGLVTAIATGIGAVPFFLVEEVSDRTNVILWGFASGIMVAASVFGLVFEAITPYLPGSIPPGVVVLLLIGAGLGAILVWVAHRVIAGAEVDPGAFTEADYRKLLVILGILTVHSFPEGVAVGVAFADLGVAGGTPILGLTVPVLAIFMTIAISIHNIPEGVAISIPLRSMGVSPWGMVWWSIFSSLPQPIGAVLAFGFVRIARDLLPAGFGFAAGAMVFLVATEFIPEARAVGADLPGGGRRELLGGFVLGAATMLPLVVV